jgi:hypothetical protein
METEDSWLCSQQPATSSYPKLDKTSPHRPMFHINSMIPSPKACKWFLSSRFSSQIEGSILKVHRSDFGILI